MILYYNKKILFLQLLRLLFIFLMLFIDQSTKRMTSEHKFFLTIEFLKSMYSQ